ncbi:hypothetical protein ACLB2K_072162 [Fragaria x ananassa]
MGTVVNTEIPVLVSVYDATILDRDASLVPTRLNWIPASRSFIQGLEPVSLDSDIIARSPSCAVCLEDFDMDQQQEPSITQLPCRHYFHLDCIVQCLERNHMCPLCRYEMPMEQDYAQGSSEFHHYEFFFLGLAIQKEKIGIWKICIQSWVVGFDGKN